MSKKLILVLLLVGSLPLYSAMVTQDKQLIIINPFFEQPHHIDTIKNISDEIEQNRLSYSDYAQRKGIIWSDFWIDTQGQNNIEECKDTIKLTLVDETLQKHNPESIFNYPVLKNILCQNILPKILTLITTNNWTLLPKKIFAQFFLQRCHSSEPMHWHQDPGEDYDLAADFSLVLMLSQQNDSQYGWRGGKFKIRSGLPTDPYNDNDIQTIIPQYNQALLFNNKTHSHAVTPITSENNNGKRDLIVIPLYFGRIPQPVRFKE